MTNASRSPSTPFPSVSPLTIKDPNDLGNIKCAFYNETLCPNGQCPMSVTKCAQDTTGRVNYCYSLWSNDSTDSIEGGGGSGGDQRVKIKQAGCLTGDTYDCRDHKQCIHSRFTKEHYFCCCKEDLCNQNVQLSMFDPEHSPQQAKTPKISGSDSIGIWPFTLIPLLLIIVLIFLVMYYVWFKRRRKDLIRSKRFHEDDESISITNRMNGLSINSCNMNGTISYTGNHHVGNNHNHQQSNGNNEHGNRSIQLIEKLSTGRFGSVWKAKMFQPQSNIIMKDVITSSRACTRVSGGGDGDGSDGSLITSSTVSINDNDERGNNYKIVAVKIFPPHERSSWIIEQLVFKTPQIEHENILRFLGSEKRDDSNNVPLSASSSGFWLITEYHELGSLCDYLKQNTVNIDQLLKISIGIASGLNHLHYEIPEGGESIDDGGNDNQTTINHDNYKMKPSIVHRDFKSRNVLLKPDLTPRIADFGLALIFYPNRTPAGLGQVGTRRYMAPEVLEGAINYTQDSLYRIDIYACGLVFWELVSRCRGNDIITTTTDEGTESLTVNEYKLPFEEEVGQNPSLEDMQEIVCQAKKRPIIQQQWLSHPFLKVICETITECWDQDSEARLSASCILERLTILARNRANTRI